MKRLLKKSLAFLLAAVMLFGAAPIIGIGFPLLASAADLNDLALKLINDDTAFEISACGWSASGDLIIPSTYVGLPVTSIGELAFYSCTDLESITLPDSLTYIGKRAFQYCKGFESIVIPASVTKIDEYAFYYCSNLVSITFAEGSKLESIGTTAFAGCSKLKSIIIPESVTSIGDDTFFECSSLESVSFAEGSKMEYISPSMFFYCQKIKSIIIPESVTSIGDDAFFSCVSLESITIPESVTSIGSNAFFNCQILSEIIVANGNANYSSLDGVLFSKDGKTLICYPIGKSGTSYDIPSNVTRIGKKAFENCNSLLSVTIPASVTSIGTDAFYGTAYYNDNDNWIDNALYIGDCFIEARLECTSCNIAEGTRLIADAAFYNAYELIAISVPESNANYSSEGSVLFSKNKDVLVCYPASKYGTSYDIPSSVTIIAGYAFAFGDKLESIDIPSNVMSIGESAFEYCSGLDSVTFAEGSKLKSIDYRLFYSCYNLKSIDIPDGVTSIGNKSFEDCESLERVTIPEGVTSIGNDAFEDCESLNSVTIPESVTYIGEDAFEDCDYISDIYYGGDESDWGNVYLGPDNNEVYNAVWHYSIVVTDVSLDITSKTLPIGATQQLTATVAPDNATNKNVTWTSSDTAIATVDESGLVTAKAEGTATITVTTRNKSKTATCLFTVVENKVEKVKIQTWPNIHSYTYKIDSFNKAGLTIIVTYTNGKTEMISDTEKIDVIGFNINQRGEQNLTVEYDGIQAEEKITVTVKYTWWQWLIKIILFGWIWY